MARRVKEETCLLMEQPQEHGMNADLLAAMTRVLPERGIKDVMIARNGAVVWEWHERGSDSVRAIYSCTKSVLSCLIGMAVNDGAIRMNEPVATYFEWLYDSDDPRIASISVRELLTMTPGLYWPEFDKPYFQMKKTSDWIRFITAQPLSHMPGETFAYNSGCSHLLSAILTRTTGQSAAQYAEERLFNKLDIRRTRWNQYNGISEGGAGLHMTTRDMLKFGMLYQQNGVWNGERLLPESWIQESTRSHSKGLVHYKPPIYGKYGYHWWVSPSAESGSLDYYFALGYGGQYLIVIPSLHMTVVIRKSVEGKNKAMLAKSLLCDYIVKAVEG